MRSTSYSMTSSKHSMRSNDPFDDGVEAFDEVNEGSVEVRDVVDDVGKGGETINDGKSRFRRRCRRKTANHRGTARRSRNQTWMPARARQAPPPHPPSAPSPPS